MASTADILVEHEKQTWALIRQKDLGKFATYLAEDFYDIFPEGKKILSDLGVTLHSLATWWDVLAVAKKSGKFDKEKLKEVESFMKDPAGWSKAHGGAAQAAE